MKEIVTLGLTEGRHELPPVDGFIFPKEVDPTDLEYINATVSEKIQSGLESKFLGGRRVF